MSEVVDAEIRASIGRLVALGRREGLLNARIREIVLGSVVRAFGDHPDPWRQETLIATCNRALDALLG